MLGILNKIWISTTYSKSVTEGLKFKDFVLGFQTKSTHPPYKYASAAVENVVVEDNILIIIRKKKLIEEELLL